MKKRGRPTRLNGKLTLQICQLLRDGISITAACDALGINQDTYFSWINKDAEFSEKATRARANGKIALVKRILADKDWRALSWYLSVCWPNEFARSVERPLPKEPESQPQKPLIEYSFKLKDGTRIPTTFQEAQKVFADFPVVETPTEVATNDDDELGCNDNEKDPTP